MKVLVGIDFDNTLVDCNSDIGIKKLHPDPSVLGECGEREWTSYMRDIFSCLHESGITSEDYERYLSEIPLVSGIADLLRDLHATGEFDIVIISDANTFFIENVLTANKLRHVVKEIFTNPAYFDSSGCLIVKEYQDQDWCNRCARNICKGYVFENYIAQQEVPYGRVAYIGDGWNDFCPALKLGPNDYVFPRKGYKMSKMIPKMTQGEMKATVVEWETGDEIQKTLLSVKA